MKYADGSEVRVGDRVRLSNGETATVVFDVDSGEYREDFPRTEWEYLGKGIMVKTDHGALVHLDDIMFERLDEPQSSGNKS